MELSVHMKLMTNILSKWVDEQELLEVAASILSPLNYGSERMFSERAAIAYATLCSFDIYDST